MVELVVICALSVLAFALALAGVRGAVASRILGDGASSVLRVLARGVATHARRQNAVAASLAGVLAGVVLVVYGVAHQLGGATGVAARQHGVLVSVSFVVGAAVTLAVASLGSALGVRVSVLVAEAARRSLDDALRVAIRGGLSVALAAQTAGTASVSFGVLAVFGYYGLVRGDRSVALAELVRVPTLLAGLALGASAVALLVGLCGGLFGGVADLGADVAGKLEEALPEDAAKNPATLADLVGDQVGEGSAHAAAGVATTVGELVATTMVAALVFQEEAAFPSVTALVLFPVVVRSFGAVAGWFGAMVVKTDDTEAPLVALQRGLYVSALLASVSMFGAATWLLGSPGPRLAAAGTLGVVASLAMLSGVQYFTDARHRPVRSLAESARSGASFATLRGLLVAIDGSLVTLAIATVALVGAYRLGVGTGLRHGGLLALALVLAGMRGTSVFVRAMDAMATVADTATGILELTIASDRPDVHARTRTLAAAGATAKNYHRVLRSVTSVVAGFLAMAVFREWTSRDAAASSALRPLVVVAGVLGLALVLAFGRVLLGLVVVAGRELLRDLRNRFGAASDAPPTPSASRSDMAWHPGAETCVEVVSRAALRGMVPPALVGVLGAFLVGVGLRLSARGDSVRESAEALVAFVSVATIAGGLGSLLFTNAGSAWDNAKRYIETGAHGGRHDRQRTPGRLAERDEASSFDTVDRDGAAEPATVQLNPTYVAAVVGDTIGDPLKGAVGPGVLALAETLAPLVLVFHPFFL